MRMAMAGLAALIGAGAALAQEAPDLCRPDRVSIRGAWGVADFDIRLADDDAERAQGLMHVTGMPQASGMLFAYDEPQQVFFWMRNTLIPLDMIFADGQGRVLRVHENARPLDETPVNGGAQVQYVLEVNGGVAARFGITAGDHLRHPMIVDPVWPCVAQGVKPLADPDAHE